MSKPGSANLLHPGRENVHPLFDPTKFAADVDYEAFYEPAVLATRLIKSPQSLQHDYSFYFGTTVPANTPSGFSIQKGLNHLPFQYACDKAVGELTKSDIKDVEKQRLLLADDISFEVHDDVVGYGFCNHHPEDATRGPHSIIGISRKVYNDALTKNRTPEQNARVSLMVACILIHEVAHAANFRLLGPVQEDFRETSNVAEAGFEAVSRIFGFTPRIWQDRMFWSTWQFRSMSSFYDLTAISRREWQLRVEPLEYGMEPEFYMKLSNDDFWTGEYLERGALALIPSIVPMLCRPESRHTAWFRAIPLSIRDLFVRNGGPSYAKKKYARYSNPDRQLRRRPEVDPRFGIIPSWAQRPAKEN